MSWQWFLIEGINPEPWQASQASVGRKGGKNFVQFYKPESLRFYQESIQEYMTEHHPQAVELPGDISLVFYFWRQLTLNEMFEGKNRRTHVADATNLQKSLEDALQNVLYQNDRNIKDIRSHIVEQGQDTLPRILIAIGPYNGFEEAQDATQIAESLSTHEEAPSDNSRDFDPTEVF